MPNETRSHGLRRPARRRVLAGGGALLLSPPAMAAYPDRPVRWIVPAPPGGGFDVLARMVAGPLGQQLEQPVVVENRPGAAAMIGAEAAARAPADGYTILTVDNGTVVFNQLLFRRLSYDADRDFRPVGLMARFHLLLTVPAASGITSARALIERAREAPERLNYGVPSLGVAHHLAMERLLRATGTRITAVPLPGMAAAMTELLAGRLDVSFVDFASGRQAMLGGGFRPLAIASRARLPQLPEVPTLEEALGLDGFEAFAWQGIMLPKATPDPVAVRLTAALAAAQATPALDARMREVGMDPLVGGPEAFDALLARERATWHPVIRQLGLVLG